MNYYNGTWQEAYAPDGYVRLTGQSYYSTLINVFWKKIVVSQPTIIDMSKGDQIVTIKTQVYHIKFRVTWEDNGRPVMYGRLLLVYPDPDMTIRTYRLNADGKISLILPSGQYHYVVIKDYKIVGQGDFSAWYSGTYYVTSHR